MFVLQLIYSVGMQVAIFGILLLVPAWRLEWPRAWVLMGVMVAATVATMFYLGGDEDLINERLKGPLQKGQPLSDRIVLILFLATFVGLVVFIPLDVFRFRLMSRPGLLLSLTGLGLFGAGWWLVALALHENTFAAPVVKYQERRGQRVIDSGVYSKVRHPMYSGFIPFIVGMCLWLGSYAAVLLAIVPIGIIAIRAVLEERFLQRKLEGYGAYMKRTRYRLIPFVW
jgi:protein-S-isoprenylcysteine O-methyltransferase Ste14